MSFASKELAELVAPVDEELLSSASGGAKDKLKRSWRGFSRLKRQEELLVKGLDNGAGSEGGKMSLEVQRRLPANFDVARSKRKITIPKIFECFSEKREDRELLGEARAVLSSKAASSAPPSTRASTRAASSRPASAALAAGRIRPTSAAKSRPVSAKSFHTVTSSTGSVGPSTSNPTTQHNKELWSDEEDEYVEKISLKPCSPAGAEKASPRAPRKYPVPGAALTPVERIGSFHSLTAWIRTKTRNQAMKTPTSAAPSTPPMSPQQVRGKGIVGIDPSMSHFLALDDFDDDELENTSLPDLLSITPDGVPARSRYYENGTYVWEPCRVVQYESTEDVYLINWEKEKPSKWVRRLNLIVDDYETEETWAQRVEATTVLRDAAERRMREYLFIDDLDDSLVASMDEDQIDRILGMVAPEFPASLLYIIEKGLTEMKVMYTHAAKESIYRYKMLHPLHQQRVVDLNLPEPVSQHDSLSVDLLSMKGVISVPCEPGKTTKAKFQRNRRYIADNLFFTHRILYHTLYKLVGKWDSFQSTPLFDADMNTLQIPCEVEVFKAHQSAYLKKVTEKLKNDWTVSAVSIIQNDLVGSFSFYDDDIEKYNQGRMKKFLRVVNMMMGHQLRELVSDAVTLYSSFLDSYKTPPVWEEEEELQDFKFGEPQPKFSARFLGLVGAKVQKHRYTGAPELRAAHVPKEDIETINKKKAEQQRMLRISLGYSPDDETAPQPGSLEFIRRKASRASTVDGTTVDTVPTGSVKHRTSEASNTGHRTSEAQVQIKEEAEEEIEHPTSAAVSGNVSLFKIRLTCNHKSIVFEPSLEEIEETVRGVLDAFFTETDDITGVSEQLFPLLSLEPFRLTANTKSLRETDETLLQAKKLVSNVLESNIKGPKQLMELYSDYQYILDIDIHEYLHDFLSASPKPCLDDYEHLCKRLQDDVNSIGSRSLNEVAFMLIKVECYEIKAHLTSKAKDIMNGIMEHLTSQCNNDIMGVDRKYNEIFEAIAVQPESPEELQKLKKYVDSVSSILETLQEDFDDVTETVQLLSKFGYIPEQKSFETYWATYSRPRKIMEELNDWDFKYKENRNRFIQQLRDNTEALVDDVSSIKKKVELLAYEDDETHTEEMYSLVHTIRDKLNDCKDRAMQFNEHETIFRMQITKHSLIKEVTQQFEPYEKLWTITHQLAEHYEKWTNGALLSLQADEVESKASTWLRDLNKLYRTLSNEAPHIIVRALKDKLEQFKPHIPLVTALLEKGMKARHWDQIGKLVGKEGKNKLAPNDEITLNILLDFGLDEKLNDVQMLSEAAAKEWRLEEQLEKMKAEWKWKQFNLKPYQNTMLLASVDDIQQLVDDHIIKTQTLLGSLDVRHIEDVVKKWEQNLLTMSAVIEEWLKCQNMWHYLEPIFASPDIQKYMSSEAIQFERVDSIWKAMMNVCQKDPRVEIRCSEERLRQSFEESNYTLEYILKQLYKFLETKRIAFPRFYFLSNEDLLEILSETKNPFRIQKHLKKCYEGIYNLTFSECLDITHITSVEGEVLKLTESVNPAEYSNLAEKWLLKVENVMQATVLHNIKEALKDYKVRDAHNSPEKRQEWMLQWPGQVVICVSQVYWSKEVEESIDIGLSGLSLYVSKGRAQLAALVDCVRGKLTRTERSTMQAMIVIEVHATDIVEKELLANNVTSTDRFTWQAQLRYYYEEQGEGRHKTMGISIRQTNACLPYGYEYLGNSGRLVITPLTDRCYRTLIGALHLAYGGAPEGPAGTGKTETTKDLAKALARYCLVYNCSDQISHNEMAKMFRGLSASGTWACFDEFNRIEVQVLSVIAQQILTIQTAIAQDRIEFEFEGALNALQRGCSIFITMNPGYAGRAELPDNLKALFRPVAMMVPDYGMIGEISLFSCGFREGRDLAAKIVATYKLCSEQLSSKRHYDYGMRAVKTVLIASGRLLARKEESGLTEKQIVLQAIHDVNYPKFLPEDLELFTLITADLFPGVDLPTISSDHLLGGLKQACKKMNMQPTETFLKKAIQVNETLEVRHGMMLIGDTYGGKTSCLNALAHSHNWVEETHQKGSKVFVNVINPKAITVGQLYGANDAVMEWSDGVLSNIFRTASNCTDPYKHWIVLDGPVDAMWIESMNTVLDDNKKLCLLNGDNIHMTSSMNMIFEVEDLRVASPATVSRCGMVYFDANELGWKPMAASWLAALPQGIKELTECYHTISGLIDIFVAPAVTFVTEGAQGFYVPGVEVTTTSLVVSMLKLWRIFIADIAEKHNSFETTQRDVSTWLEGLFIFSVTWAIGGWLSHAGRYEFSTWFMHKVRGRRGTRSPRKAEGEGTSFNSTNPNTVEIMVQLPQDTSLFNVYFKIDPSGGYSWLDWSETQAPFTLPEDCKYHEIIVPTSDTIRHTFLLKTLASEGVPVSFSGITGTGKSLLIKSTIDQLTAATDVNGMSSFSSYYIQFSARTTSNQTQTLIESCFERRRKGVIGPPLNKRCLVFIDDFSMPDVEGSGAQPAIELLRQWMDYKGWYDHSKGSTAFKTVEGLVLLAAQAPGINSVSLLPTPEKPHYMFNLRDLSKIFQGMSQCFGTALEDFDAVLKLWMHETMRVYQDRLTTASDVVKFNETLNSTLGKHFRRSYESLVGHDMPLIFDDITADNSAEPLYREISDMDVVKKRLEIYQNEYNDTLAPADIRLNLVVFNYVIEHVSRLCRIIKMPMGNALIVGLGGRGRQSAAKLATFVCDYKLYRIVTQKNYTRDSWREDIKKCIKGAAGPSNTSPTCFLITDESIKEEAFLEDISCLLNTGEIPNLFEEEDLTPILDGLAKLAKELGRREGMSRKACYKQFVQRTRSEVHVIMCFSPVGSTLRNRIRVFPSLVNCCAIDHFAAWPTDGLVSVGNKFVVEEIPANETQVDSIVGLCVKMHLSTKRAAETYHMQTKQEIHTTPTSYLELLSCFKRILITKTDSASSLKERYEKGIEQLIKTENSVGAMQDLLEVQQPRLVAMAEETATLIEKIENDERDADVTRQAVFIEERAANEKAEEAKKIKDACETVLARAMPALEAAMAQVADIDRRQIVEVRSMTNPNDKIKAVLSAVCVCLGTKPVLEKDPANPKKKRSDYWAASKKLMSDTNEFLNTLLTYKDREEGLDPNIFEAGTGLIQPYLQDKNFNPDKVRTLSKALAPICAWVIAVEKYYQVEKRVRPRKAELERAVAEYDVAMNHLELKKKELERLDSRLQEMRTTLEKSQNDKLRLENEYKDTEKKLRRAQLIISGLGDERERYFQQSELQSKLLENILGDSLLSASYFAYLAPFTQTYRTQLLDSWKEAIATMLPMSVNFELSALLGEAVKIEEWKVQGLPADSFSIDNSLIMEHTNRWPMVIDPQQQITAWLKERYANNNLQVLRPNQEGYIKSIAMAVNTGCPVLLEGCDSELDPVLNPLLLKQVNKDASGVLRINIGDQTEVVYHKNWTDETPPQKRARLFLATKHARPNFKPEIAAKVTLIAASITPEGLQDQLLGKVVQHEERELDEKKNRNMKLGARNKMELKKMEDEILALLSSNENILDSEEAIVALNEAQRVAEEASLSQREVDRILTLCDRSKKKFVDVADNASRLFFCATDLSVVDPMYQYSLQWFLSLFVKSLEGSRQTDKISGEDRNTEIAQHFFESFYKNMCRSLFAKDTLMLSFLMACVLTPDVGPELLRFFCTLGIDKPWSHGDDDKPVWLPTETWNQVQRLCSQMPVPFRQLASDISGSSGTGGWQQWYKSDKVVDAPLPAPWKETLKWTGASGINRLLLFRVLRPDKLTAAIQHYVSNHPLLGTSFTVPPVFNLQNVFRECPEASQPLIFILSSGVDPIVELKRLAEEENMSQKMHTLSLGQGIQSRAEKLIVEGKSNGWWVVLQNCHLYKDWMPQLERIIEEYSSASRASSLHMDFRLWLTSMPSTDFPASVLMNGTKMIVEAPRGLRQNLLGSYSSVPLADPEFYEVSSKQATWKKLCYALCFFHAVIQERRAFGPLGWNISYEFNKTDLTISLKQLKDFVEQYDNVPYDALTYLTGECNYGGRVTDDRDRRCLMATLGSFYSESILDSGYSLDPEGAVAYIMPDGKDLDVPLEFTAKLPANAPPSIFGLHNNAEIAKNKRDASLLLSTLLSTQPRTAVTQDEASQEQQAITLITSIIKDLPKQFNMAVVKQRFPTDYKESMNTVLRMELLRYNELLSVIRNSLKALRKALRGEAVLTEALEVMYHEVLDGVLPSSWEGHSYPSLKPLGSYIADLHERVAFFSAWMEKGAPNVFWLGGFFFTQSFLTGVQQNYAREKAIEIDTLMWNFSMLAQNPSELTAPPANGCYVHGLYLECAAWNIIKGHLVDAPQGLLHDPFPVVCLHLKQIEPEEQASDEHGLYQAYVNCPLYKTQARRGVLSTTGHDSNFIMMFKVPIDPVSDVQSHPEFWVQRGIALVTQLSH
eukprot:TRINITY_DN4256_c2_g1_i2.p1 TRINITY_DN4256_c2_g1~~TRINITY_DN4256_c2_g1_i2.p1  ORF type:complete len:4454 (+),score=1223.71 TRINITY_DN4256_c2_g1_i2:62-13363(+)